MKRFYKQAEPLESASGHGVALDRRPVKTPGKRELIVPKRVLAAAIAEEWNAQEGEIRPATMPLTRLATTAIDRVATRREAVIEETANYAGTDLVCYRAAHPPALAARQQAVWQPLIDWAALRYDAPLAITTGVILKASRGEPSRICSGGRGAGRLRADRAACGDHRLRLAGHRLGAHRGAARRAGGLRHLAAR